MANETVLEEESDDYQRGYMNAMSAHQWQYSLQNRDVPVNPIQKRKEATTLKNDPTNVQKKGKETTDPSSSKTTSTNERSNQLNVSKDKMEKKDVLAKEVEKV